MSRCSRANRVGLHWNRYKSHHFESPRASSRLVSIVASPAAPAPESLVVQDKDHVRALSSNPLFSFPGRQHPNAITQGASRRFYGFEIKRIFSSLQSGETVALEGNELDQYLSSLDQASLAEKTEALKAALKDLAQGKESREEYPSKIDKRTSPEVTREYCYSILVAWTRFQNLRAAQMAHSVLLAMAPLKPSRLCYDEVLQAYATCDGGSEAAWRAHKLVLDMKNGATSSPKTTHQADQLAIPNTKTFNIAIRAWAKSNDRASGAQSDVLLGAIEEFHASQVQMYKGDAEKYFQQRDTAPNIRTLIEVVEAWFGSKDRKAPDRVMEIFERALKGHQAKDDSTIELCTVFFNSIIKALSLTQNIKRAQEAENMLQIMQDFDISPNTRTYASIIHIWSQCEASLQDGRAAERAEDILMRTINLFVNEGQDVRPNKFGFASCISAWSNCSMRVPHAAERAQRLYDLMADLHTRTGDPILEPDIAIGNAIINAWARSSKNNTTNIKRAEEIFQKMKSNSSVDLISYHTIMHAYGSRGDVQSTATLFKELEERAKENAKFRPNDQTYNIALTALSNTRSVSGAREAEHMLKGMKSPSNQSFTSVITAWARSGDPSPVRSVRNLFLEMVQRSTSERKLTPDPITYMTIIHACSMERLDKEEAMQTITDCVAHMAQSKKQDHRVFHRTLKAYRRLASNGENLFHHVSQMVAACKSSGMLSKSILNELWTCFHDQAILNEVIKLPHDGRIPDSWSSKLPHQEKP